MGKKLNTIPIDQAQSIRSNNHYLGGSNRFGKIIGWKQVSHDPEQRWFSYLILFDDDSQDYLQSYEFEILE